MGPLLRFEFILEYDAEFETSIDTTHLEHVYAASPHLKYDRLGECDIVFKNIVLC
jgi:hypothetical protein